MNTENTNCFVYETEESATTDRLLIKLLGGVSSSQGVQIKRKFVASSPDLALGERGDVAVLHR